MTKLFILLSAFAARGFQIVQPILILIVCFILPWKASAVTKTVEGGKINFSPLVVDPDEEGNPLKFDPTNRITIDRITFRINCHQKPSTQLLEGCSGFKVNGKDVGTYQVGGKKLNLYEYDVETKKVDKNTFELPKQIIEFSTDRGGHLCILVKVFFAEVPHSKDWKLYYEPPDRYSLLSYCTVWELPKWVDDRFFNRELTGHEFNAKLWNSIPVKLNKSEIEASLKMGDR